MTSVNLDYGNFKYSLKNLETQYEHFLTLPPEYPQYIREGMAESVIQRFETGYDSLWKALRRHLIEALGNPDVPNSPGPFSTWPMRTVCWPRAAGSGRPTCRLASTPRMTTVKERRTGRSPLCPTSSTTPSACTAL